MGAGPVLGMPKVDIHPHQPDIRELVRKWSETYAPMGEHKYYSPQAIFIHLPAYFTYSHTDGHCYNYCHNDRTGGFRYH